MDVLRLWTPVRSSGPGHERPVFDEVIRHVETVGPFHADIVSVGIFLKNPRKFAELRPMQSWVAVSFSLGRRARHRLITRKVVQYGDKYWHALCELLTEAYGLVAPDDHRE